MKWNTSMDAVALDAAWKGIGDRRARLRNMRRVKIAAAPLLTAALVAILFLIVGRPSTITRGEVAAIALATGAPLPTVPWESEQTVDFSDGSHLFVAKDTHIKALPSQDPSRVDMLLESGHVTFDIKPNGPRAWVIEAGNGMRVRVLGTRFTVTRDPKKVHVAVARGKVRVESTRLPQGERDLVAGQDLDVVVVEEVERRAPAPSTTTTAIPVENLASAKPATPRRAPTAPPPSAPDTAPAETQSDPFADADAARKAGRPRDAVTILKGASNNQALAAFTIGKIHAEELHEPAAAATWFERAIHLGLATGLEEDAYARVVECNGQAGNKDEAARAAERYQAKFPSGRHLARVQRWAEKR